MFHLDHVNRLPKQTQRHVYGYAAPAQRRGGGGGVKIFHWGVSPSKKFEHSYHVSMYTFGHLNQQAFIPPAFSLPPTNTLPSATFTHITRMQSTPISTLSGNLGI